MKTGFEIQDDTGQWRPAAPKDLWLGAMAVRKNTCCRTAKLSQTVPVREKGPALDTKPLSRHLICEDNHVSSVA